MSKASKRTNPGFLLIELLIAMSLMMIIWLVIARYQSSVLNAVYMSQQRMKAINLATRLLDAEPLVMQKKEIDEFMVTYNAHNRSLITPANLENYEITDKDFKLITINVAWNHNGHIQSVELTSGKLNRKRAL